jgi:hypothetical protein
VRRDICREIHRFKPDVVVSSGHEIGDDDGLPMLLVRVQQRHGGHLSGERLRLVGLDRWYVPGDMEQVVALAPKLITQLVASLDTLHRPGRETDTSPPRGAV